jgi:hypothetical protein
MIIESTYNIGRTIYYQGKYKDKIFIARKYHGILDLFDGQFDEHEKENILLEIKC